MCVHSCVGWLIGRCDSRVFCTLLSVPVTFRSAGMCSDLPNYLEVHFSCVASKFICSPLGGATVRYGLSMFNGRGVTALCLHAVYTISSLFERFMSTKCTVVYNCHTIDCVFLNTVTVAGLNNLLYMMSNSLCNNITCASQRRTYLRNL